MNKARRAVIDLGTNSIKVLVADVAGSQLTPVWESSEQTRLGEGFFQTHLLQPGPVASTAQAVAEFCQRAQELGAESTRILATSAVRDAENPSDLIGAIAAVTHLPVEVISGEMEAELAFRGATTDPRLSDTPILLLDLGGGSTEFILGHGPKVDFRQSYRLGAVRLTEQVKQSDPPTRAELRAARDWVAKFLEQHVTGPLLAKLEEESRQEGSETQLVGTGGTATILARMEAGMDTYDREVIEGQRLSRERLEWHIERLWTLPLEQRKGIPGLPPKRADIITSGALIYGEIMRALGFGELRVSTRGLRFAAIM